MIIIPYYTDDRQKVIVGLTSIYTHRKSDTLPMRYPWEILFQYREQRDFFMLYLGINQAILLPRSFFHSEEDWQLFRKLVTEKLPNQPKKKSQNRLG